MSRNFPNDGMFSLAERELDEKQHAVRRHSLAAVDEDGAGLFVVPVMDDALHQVGPAAGRNVLEEVAGLHGGTSLEVAGEELALACTVEDVLLIGEDAAQLRMSAEDFGEQKAVPAADVHQALPCAKVVGCGDGGADEPGHGCHGVIEDACQFRVAANLLEAVIAG